MAGAADSDTLTLSVSGEQDDATAARCDQLFVVIHGERPLTPPSRHLLVGIDEIVIGRGGGDAVVHVRRGRTLELRLPDRRMSSAHARLERMPIGWTIIDGGSKNGTYVGDQRVTQRALLADGAVFSVGHVFLQLRMQQAADGALDVAAAPRPGSLETLSVSLAARFAALARVAATDTPVLVLGESGTGKERVARAYHEVAGRRGALVPVNCGALPPPLAASELFGHKRGAFSGADFDRIGLVSTADGGTLFLDEIGDLPRDVQPALLRVLQEREVTPVGISRAQSVDVRVVAATHRALDHDVASGAFRRDLYGRLAGFTLVLPPLRERREDLGVIVAELIGRHASEPAAISLARSTTQRIFSHAWPQNVRELEHALKVAIALSTDGVVRLDPLLGSSDAPEDIAADAPRSERRAAQLRVLLEEHQGNVAAVARALGRQRTLVHRWLREHGIDPERFRL